MQRKSAMMKLVETMSDDAKWSDLMYEAYIREKIEEGLKAAENNITVSHEEAKKILTLP